MIQAAADYRSAPPKRIEIGPSLDEAAGQGFIDRHLTQVFTLRVLSSIIVE